MTARGEWQAIESADRHDDAPPVFLLQDGRRFLGEWDDAAGHWQGIAAYDGVETERYMQEWPGRLYSVTHWAPASPVDDLPPLPSPPEQA